MNKSNYSNTVSSKMMAGEIVSVRGLTSCYMDNGIIAGGHHCVDYWAGTFILDGWVRLSWVILKLLENIENAFRIPKR